MRISHNYPMYFLFLSVMSVLSLLTGCGSSENGTKFQNWHMKTTVKQLQPNQAIAFASVSVIVDNRKKSGCSLNLVPIGKVDIAGALVGGSLNHLSPFANNDLVVGAVEIGSYKAHFFCEGIGEKTSLYTNILVQIPTPTSSYYLGDIALTAQTDQFAADMVGAIATSAVHGISRHTEITSITITDNEEETQAKFYKLMPYQKIKDMPIHKLMATK